LPLGVTAFLVNMVVPHLFAPLGPRILFPAGWVLAIPGLVLLSLIGDGGDYWRFAFPGMILYIAGVGSVYLLANLVVVGSAPPEDQGTVAGIFNVRIFNPALSLTSGLHTSDGTESWRCSLRSCAFYNYH
jgi:hypothetical protein